MKRNRKHNILGWLAASALLLTTSCADNADLLQGGGNGTNTVTFTLRSQMQTGGTRADGHDDLPHISDGSKADVLIFAIYEEKETDGKKTWVVVDDAKKNGAQLDEDRLGKNNNSITVNNLQKNPVTIQLTLNPEKKYKAAFWAQSKSNFAYDTQDLTKVKVNYEYYEEVENKESGGTSWVTKKYSNNNELRDAFCAFVEFDGSQSNVEATLRRPFAQVNVGTTGWDYEGAAILKPSAVSYTKSEITLDGVAQYYNVLTGKALAEGDPNLNNGEEATTTVTYEYERIPAAVNVENWDGSYLPFADEGEEYLTVDVNKDTKIAEYVGWDEYYAYRTGTTDTAYEGKYAGKYKDQNTKALFDEGKLPATETYKYLSMCYVLVPEPRPFPAVGNGTVDEETGEHIGSSGMNVTYGSVLSSVSFSAKGIEVKDEPASDDQVETPDAGGEVDGTVAEGTSEEAGIGEVFTIYNVPVQKNWRTNILGNIFTINEKFKLDVVPEYMGDYNYDMNQDYGDNEEDGSWPLELKQENKINFNIDDESGDYTVSDNEKDNGFFSFGNQENKTNKHNHATISGNYNGSSFTRGLKMEGSTVITFTTTNPLATVLIVQSTEYNKSKGIGQIKFDGEELDINSAEIPSDGKSQNVRVYTIKNVSKGEHIISKGSGEQSVVFYVEVKQYDVKDETVDGDDTYGEKFPDYNKKDE